VSEPAPAPKNRPFRDRLRHALAGIGEACRRERSFRTQLAAAGAALAFLLILRPPAVWWALVALVSALVLAVELVNSALEALIDYLHPELHPEIRRVKDMAAGAVLVLSMGAVAVGALLAIALL
jgi:undecaprenol kinase